MSRSPCLRLQRSENRDESRPGCSGETTEEAWPTRNPSSAERRRRCSTTRKSSGCCAPRQRHGSDRLNQRLQHVLPENRASQPRGARNSAWDRKRRHRRLSSSLYSSHPRGLRDHVYESVVRVPSRSGLVRQRFGTRISPSHVAVSDDGIRQWGLQGAVWLFRPSPRFHRGLGHINWWTRGDIGSGAVGLVGLSRTE